jgi:hypothetical protein
MKTLFIILTVCLTLYILYFLFTTCFYKDHAFNRTLKIKAKKDAAFYLVIGVLLAPVLGWAVNGQMDQMIAESKGFATFEAFEAETAKAAEFSLTLARYQSAMKKAKMLGFAEYTAYQEHLEARKHGYDTYELYYTDVKFAIQYDLPLTVYRKAKVESISLNYPDFSAYLVHREETQLNERLPLITDLSGSYTIENVPLSIKKDKLIALVNDCSINKIPEYKFPLTKTLAPRNQATVNHFFPATEVTSRGFGLAAYSLNFEVMQGLDLQAISKYEMKCETSRYDLWFLNSDDSLVMYEKAITMPQYSYASTLTKINGLIATKCDSEVSTGLEMTFEKNGTRDITNYYCKNFQDYIVATIVDGPTIAGVRQDAEINISYINSRLWKKYLENLHAVKRKKKSRRVVESKYQQETAASKI